MTGDADAPTLRGPVRKARGYCNATFRAHFCAPIHKGSGNGGEATLLVRVMRDTRRLREAPGQRATIDSGNQVAIRPLESGIPGKGRRRRHANLCTWRATRFV